MKKITMLFVLLVAGNYLSGQNGITFQVEELVRPEKQLYMSGYDQLYGHLIRSAGGMYGNDNENIIAKSDAPDSLVTFGYHSFFNGMYQAYADHRPFVLSPDMIWLLISQGFARHVNANAEQLRPYFVDFSGKTSLVVVSEDIGLHSPAGEWEKIFPEFTGQIGKYTGKELIDVLTADFSTTTPAGKVASEITIMEAMKPYFEFVAIYGVCGIPEITLKGTPEDWQKVLDKAQALSKYELRWWIGELEPVLKEFVKASKGKVNTRFWRNMFKYHSKKRYGDPDIIDGWIVKFFPYDKDGRPNNLEKLEGLIVTDSLPDEIVKVDMTYIELSPDGHTTEISLELWAGFIGLEQKMDDYALTPVIGWMIRKKDVDNVGLQQSFESSGNIEIRVVELPEALLKVRKIKSLYVDFVDRIIIPDGLKNVEIEALRLNGKISGPERKRIKNMFPDSRLEINGKVIIDKEVNIFQ